LKCAKSFELFFFRVSCTDKNKLLYKNDGNNFEDNWQEREIERYEMEGEKNIPL
jgi:hypothetical protein